MPCGTARVQNSTTAIYWNDWPFRNCLKRRRSSAQMAGSSPAMTCECFCGFWPRAYRRQQLTRKEPTFRAGETETSAAGGATDRGAKRGRRPDALGTSGHERVASQGCPHCAGRAIVAWGRSHGLSRFRCKSCGRTFNALTKTAMAHLHKRERWFDHARAMIEGKSLAKTAELCGVHPTTAFRWRHRFLGAPAADKPEKAERNRRGGRNLHP